VLLAILLLALIPQGAFFGVDRLLTSVRENVGRSARQIRDAIIADVDAFVDNAPQRDDIALVVLARDSKQDSDRVTNDE
jgi:serine phosphatase RsbU (regulator of sigma subunit)